MENDNLKLKMSHRHDILTFCTARPVVKALLSTTGVILIFAFYIFNSSTANAGVIVKPLNNLGLVGYWDFNEGTGTNAEDKSGNKNNGTLTNGPTRVASKSAKFGDAISFDGTDDYVDVGNIAILNPNQITVSAWVKYNSTANEQEVLGKWGSGGITTTAYVLGVNSSGKLFAKVVNATPTQVAVTDSASFSSGVWTYVTVSYDGATVKLFKNGTMVASTSQTGNINSVSASFYIGAIAFTSLLQWNGTIDEVRIYNRALSASEVAKLYNTGRGGSQATSARVPKTGLNKGLVGYWNFNETDGITAFDQTTYGNKGTLTNGPTSVAGKDGFGKAINFDGTNDYVSFARMLTGTTYTISAWINSKSSTSAGQGVFYQGTAANDLGTRFLVATCPACTVTNGNTVTLFFGNEGEGTFLTAPNNSIVLNTWQHVVIVKNGANEQMYIDGVLQSSRTNGSTTVPTNNSSYIGFWYASSDSTRFFQGGIDDPRIWNRALTADEVRHLYNAGNPLGQKLNASQNKKLTSGLVGLWSFDGPDMAGVTAYDRSGQANNGTLTNGPVRTIGKLGQALSFDGTNDEVDIGVGGLGAAISGASAVTITAWVRAKTITSPADDNLIIGGLMSTGSFGIELNIEGSGKTVRAGGRSVSTDAFQSKTGTTALSTNTWYHVAGVFDYPNDTIDVYVNGVDETATNGVTFANMTYTHSVYASAQDSIGGLVSSAGYAIDGSIDDVRIYNRALSPAELTRLYNMGR